jgi:hypothetical protein
VPGETELGYLGRYPQGEELPLVVQCDDGSGPAWPAVAPVASFRGPAGTNVLSRVMAADQQGVGDGLFRLPQFLGPEFSSTGEYAVLVRYKDSAGNPRLLAGHFQLTQGGSTDGAVIAVRSVRRPNANWLVYQTDGGRLVRGRNPR